MIDENGKVGIGFLEQMFTIHEDEGSGMIQWKWKNQEDNNKFEHVTLVENYKNACKSLNGRKVICKIEPQFVNNYGIKKEIKRSIARKLEEAIENLVNRWLNTGIWNGRKLCVYLGSFKFKNDICLKSGEIGKDHNLKNDIEELIENSRGQADINFEIGNWWLSGRWREDNVQSEEWGRKDGKSDGKGVTWKLIEFAGSVGQLSTEALKKQAVKELIEEFERGIINQRGDFCGIWNKGITCPDGGLIL